VRPGEKPPVFDRRFLTHDQGGAIAFAAYFYKALDWSFATNNANLLRPISSPTCTACQSFVHAIDGVVADGGYSTGARLNVLSFAPKSGGEFKADYVVAVVIHQGAQVVFYPHDAPITHSAPTPDPTTTYVYMNWRAGSYIVIGLSR
jgi:hypothetical protein